MVQNTVDQHAVRVSCQIRAHHYRCWCGSWGQGWIRAESLRKAGWERERLPQGGSSASDCRCRGQARYCGASVERPANHDTHYCPGQPRQSSAAAAVTRPWSRPPGAPQLAIRPPRATFTASTTMPTCALAPLGSSLPWQRPRNVVKARALPLATTYRDSVRAAANHCTRARS